MRARMVHLLAAVAVVAAAHLALPTRSLAQVADDIIAENTRVTLSEVAIRAGRLIVSGKTSRPRTRVTLDDAFQITSGVDRRFRFALLHLPSDCTVDLRTPYGSDRLLVAGCGQVPSAVVSEEAGLEVSKVAMEGGRLVVQGTTAEPRTRVKLEGQFIQRSNRNGAFQFSELYQPLDCKIRLNTPLGVEKFLVSGCGPRGRRGKRGRRGFTGEPGETGATGPVGETGPQGEQGPQGGTGALGPAGPQGNTGATGPAGPQGEAGAQGAKGLQWRGTWNAATDYVTDDTVQLGGNTYVALQDGTNKNPASETAHWSLLAQKGEKGETGDKGDKGDAGDQGEVGPAGTQGPQGEAGAQGLAGPKGDTGPQGPAGPNTVADGTVGAPAINFASSPSTGIFSPEVGKIALTAAGNLFLHNIGNDITAIGYRALSQNTEGFDNTAVGNSALFLNTLGDFNTAVGDVALRNNTIGTDNTAVGNDALSQNTEGHRNVAVGSTALYANIEGGRNIAGIRYSPQQHPQL